MPALTPATAAHMVTRMQGEDIDSPPALDVTHRARASDATVRRPYLPPSLVAVETLQRVTLVSGNECTFESCSLGVPGEQRG